MKRKVVAASSHGDLVHNRTGAQVHSVRASLILADATLVSRRGEVR
jgi:hypothetical protein